MATRLNGAGGMVDDIEETRPRLKPTDMEPALEIYGPLGTRAYVRNGLVYTHTILGATYVVHELRLPSDPQTGDHTSLPAQVYELPGRNILQADDGAWHNIFHNDTISVSAAPILHSVPCVGYVVNEAPVPGKIDPALFIPHLKRTKTPMSVMRQLQQGETITLSDGTVLKGPEHRPGRRIAVLGDTLDPSPIASLAHRADLLIHEATNAHLPNVDPDTKDTDTFQIVEARTKSRGHSTPQMAGAFATRVGARKLVLNHFSARYAGDNSEDAARIMDAIRALAQENFAGPIACARDLMSLEVEHSFER